MNKKNGMSKAEFGERMAEGVALGFGEDYVVKTQEVKKNNNVKMLGITVTKKSRNISPTIYLEGFYDQYLNGKSCERILESIMEALEKGMPAVDLDLSFFSDFNEVRKKLCYKLINAEKNSSLLEEIPYIPYLDLAICFYYPINDKGIGKGSILIMNNHMDLWGTNVKELWEIAAKNTRKLNPAECFTTERMMLEMVGACTCEEPVGELPQEQGIPMYILTNHERSFGAAVILYEGYLEKLAECIGGAFYLLPSSVHEMILLPKIKELNDEEDSESLREIVEEVNHMVVEEQDVLSDSVYLYDERLKKLCVKETAACKSM